MGVLENRHHEIFCQEILKGQSQFAAYCCAYPNVNTNNRNSVDVSACKLMKEQEIQDRIEELKQQTADAAVMSVLERKLALTQFATDELAYPKMRMQAIDLLNKMDNIYVKKLDADVKVTDTSKVAAEVQAILDS